MSKQSHFKQLLSISTQFSSIRPINRSLSRATIPGRVELGAMTMKGFSAFPKPPALLEPYHENVNVISRKHVGESHPFTEVQSVYLTTPADCARKICGEVCQNCVLPYKIDMATIV